MEHFDYHAASPEAAKAIALMPVPLMNVDWDEEIEETAMVPIKFTYNNTKYQYLAYYISGKKGSREAIPHAMHCEQLLDEIEGLDNVGKAIGFKAATYGTALKYAKKALQMARTPLSNTDKQVPQVADDQGPKHRYGNFHDFMVYYCSLYGHNQDRRYQRDGIKYLRKPRACSVAKWHLIIQDKNEAIPYCKGNGNQYTDEEMVPILFGTFPIKWQNDYSESPSNDLSTATMDSIIEYMTNKEANSISRDAAALAQKLLTSKNTRKRTHNDKDGDDADQGSSHNTKDTRHRRPQADDKDTNNNGRCRTCRHNHLWKDCKFNPRNPTNILGKLAEQQSNGNPKDDKNNKRSKHTAFQTPQDGGHNGAIVLHDGWSIDD